jgi:hypothetical protein
MNTKRRLGSNSLEINSSAKMQMQSWLTWKKKIRRWINMTSLDRLDKCFQRKPSTKLSKRTEYKLLMIIKTDVRVLILESRL